MATGPWIGYGPWAIAKDQGFFAKSGVKVDQTSFKTAADLDAAFTAGGVDVANVPTNTALRMRASGARLKIVLIESLRMKADAIIAPGSITTVKQLKGKRVAFEKNTTADLLLAYALQTNGMTMADIEAVPTPAAEAATALVDRKVDAAVTNEPYISPALDKSAGWHRLFSADAQPGLISDVLIVSDGFLKNRPKAIAGLVKSWDLATKYYDAHPEASRSIIAAAIGADSALLGTAFEGVRLYGLKDNKGSLSQSFKQATVPYVLKVATEFGMVNSDVSMDDLFDTSFVGK